MKQNPLENKKSKQEKLDVRIEVAKLDDWEAYKKLRLMGISGSDSATFGITEEDKIKRIKEETLRTEKEWKADLSREDMFVLLAWNGSIPTGLVRAERKTNEWWHMGWLYVPDEFKRKGIGRKIMAAELNKIIKENGIKASGFIKDDNEKSINNLESLGGKKVDSNLTGYSKETKKRGRELGFSVYEVDLTDPEVVKKINEVLNAG